MSGEKTEKPTAKKRKESRKEGQVPRTQELGQWSALLVFGLLVNTLAAKEFEAVKDLMRRSLRLVAEPTVPKAMELFGDAMQHALVAVVLLGGAVMLVGVAGALSQGGFYLATKAVKPKLSKLNPINGLKRMFGPQSLWEGAKMLLKSSLVALLVYRSIKSLMPLIGGLVPPMAVLDLAGGHIRGLLLNVALAGVAMAAADYAFQRRKIGKQTRMSKDDIKQEHRQSEGDPMVKSAIRSRQLAAARSRMMADIATADVILVNPTHVAIGLRYDPEAGAPKVVARGAGAVAAKIRERAGTERVPLVRDVPLARALYSSCKVGQEIPPELFNAVAQVLAFVISRRSLGQRGGELLTPRRGQDLPEVPKAGTRRRTRAPEGSTPGAPGR